MYDVVIIGAGPAGLFAAKELSDHSSLKILVVEQGKDIEERFCIISDTQYCINCAPCEIMCGVGGSGGLSDGTLNLRPDVGGDLGSLVGDNDLAWRLVKKVDSIFLEHGAPDKLYGQDASKVEELSRKASAADIRFVNIPQRHIGTDYAPKVIKSLKDRLVENGVKILANTSVNKMLENGVEIDGEVVPSRYKIAAPGRVGATWFAEQAKKMRIKMEHGPIDVGVRVEVPSVVMDPIIEVNRDPKFHIYTKKYDDFIRTFCVNHRGFVVQETYGEYIGINGHALRDRESDNSNFGFLTRINLTEPVEDTTAYGRSIAELATTIGGGKPILQRLGDLRRGRRSTWNRINKSQILPTLKAVTPGDIAMALPHRIVTDIIEGLERLDRVIPGVASDSTLVYAPEIKFYAMQVKVTQYMETTVPNLFVAGDGAGLSRGIVNAAATGLIAACGILRKEGMDVEI